MRLLATIRGYGRDDARHDAIAAAVLVTLLVPAGLGYAELAELPVVTGLYATVAALSAYGLSARFGPDRFHPTLGRAVSSYLAATGTQWVDWTDLN